MMILSLLWWVLLVLLHLITATAKPPPRPARSTVNNVPNTVKNATKSDLKNEHSSANTYELRYDTTLDIPKRIGAIQARVQSKSFRKLISFEAQLAELIKMEPILLLQYGIALWTLVNCLLEGSYQERFKIRIRAQTLVLVIFSRLIDVYLRMNTLPIDDNKNKNVLAGFIDEAVEIPNRINSLQSYNTTTLYKKAKSDIRQLVKQFSSQQIIYSVMVVFFFNGNSALSPLIPIAISDVPFLTQFTTIIYNIFSVNEAHKNKNMITDYLSKYNLMYELGSNAFELLVLTNMIMVKLQNNAENVFLKVIRLIIIGQYTYHMMSALYPKIMSINTRTKTKTKTKKNEKKQ